MVDTIDLFQERNPTAQDTTAGSDVPERVKFARMSFDQVYDMHAEQLLQSAERLTYYAPIIAHYPGFKYIHRHIPLQLINGLPI